MRQESLQEHKAESPRSAGEVPVELGGWSEKEKKFVKKKKKIQKKQKITKEKKIT